MLLGRLQPQLLHQRVLCHIPHKAPVSINATGHIAASARINPACGLPRLGSVSLFLGMSVCAAIVEITGMSAAGSTGRGVQLQSVQLFRSGLAVGISWPGPSHLGRVGRRVDIVECLVLLVKFAYPTVSYFLHDIPRRREVIHVERML